MALSKNFDIDRRQQVQSFFMGILGKNFIQISDKPCSQYFDLFISLIDLSSIHSGLSDELSDNAVAATYEPGTLLAQIIDKIIDTQKPSGAAKSQADQQMDD